MERQGNPRRSSKWKKKNKTASIEKPRPWGKPGLKGGVQHRLIDVREAYPPLA